MQDPFCNDSTSDERCRDDDHVLSRLATHHDLVEFSFIEIRLQFGECPPTRQKLLAVFFTGNGSKMKNELLAMSSNDQHHIGPARRRVNDVLHTHVDVVRWDSDHVENDVCCVNFVDERVESIGSHFSLPPSTLPFGKACIDL